MDKNSFGVYNKNVTRK